MSVSTIYSDKILQEFPYADPSKLSRKIMINFIIAMLFPIGAGFYFFGLAMVRAVIACIVFSVFTEFVLNKIMQKENTLHDLTAVATGMIIAINMRPGLGLYPLLLSCIVGVAVGKIIFGGVGFNPINPAVIGSLLPIVGFPVLWSTAIRPTIPNLMEYAGLTYWEATQYVFVHNVKTLPFYDKIVVAQPANAPYSFSTEINPYYDVLSGTTYLESVQSWSHNGVMPKDMTHLTEFFDYWTLFIGNIPGTLGETSKLALLMGFAYLIITRVISPLVPTLVIGFMMVFGWVFGSVFVVSGNIGPLGLFAGDPLLWTLAGGTIFGAIYMNTDPVSSPRSTQAKILYALFFVIVVTSIRLIFAFPEGTAFALLSSNIIIPLVDKLCDPKNKYATKITKTLIWLGIIITVFLIGMFFYKKFL